MMHDEGDVRARAAERLGDLAAVASLTARTMIGEITQAAQMIGDTLIGRQASADDDVAADAHRITDMQRPRLRCVKGHRQYLVSQFVPPVRRCRCAHWSAG